MKTEEEIRELAALYSGRALGAYPPACEAEEKAFVAGARQYVQAVWHPASEVPQNKEVLLLDAEERPFIGTPGNEEEYRDIARALRLTRWAYVSDLLPDRKKVL